MRPSSDIGLKRTRGAGFIAVAVVAFLLLAGSVENFLGCATGLSGTAAAATDETPDIQPPAFVPPVLMALERLESKHGVVSYSRDARIEAEFFGKSMGKAARELNAELQRSFAKQVWAAAVRHSSEFDDLLNGERDPDGSVRVFISGSTPILIPPERLERYGSLTFSLRALLAAQQDFIASSPAAISWVPTDEEVSRLHQFLDRATLAALELSDRQRGERKGRGAKAESVRTAWESLVPGIGSESPQGNRAAGSRPQELALLEALFDHKLSAQKAHTGFDLDGHEARHRFVTNLHRFYARAPLPEDQRVTREIVDTLYVAIEAFGLDLVAQASKNAHEAGRRVIRIADATQTVRRSLPHRVDKFDNAHFFSKLIPEHRVTLEGFEVDSFRDYGVHWDTLKRVIHRLPEDGALPDPFAVEILAEAISHYGVLLLRLAGGISLQTRESIRLEPANLGTAATRIAQRVRDERNPAKWSASQARSKNQSDSESDAKGPLFFSDVTGTAKIDFVHRSSRWLGKFRHQVIPTPPTFSGGGIAAEDVDGDSDMDLLLVGGEGIALLINDGRGHFSDLTRDAGLVRKRPDGSYGEARMPIIADFDNDGRQDILITFANDDHQLYRNLGELRFENVSSTAGLGGQGVLAGPATVMDFDQDGLLDLYVCHIGDYLGGNMPVPVSDNRNALPNKLFRNLGGMRFEDVTEGSGTADTGWCQAVSHVDFDRDGLQDLVVANDFGRNALLRNLGDGRFEDWAPDLGVDKVFHSMNVGYSDFNDDGYPDIYFANLATMIKDEKYFLPDANLPPGFDLRAMDGMSVSESDMFYISKVSEGKLVGYERSSSIERGATTTGWAWDAEFFDFDHDGDDDLYLVNGSNDYNAFSGIYGRMGDDGKREQVMLHHARQSNVFFRNQGGRLVNVSPQSGADFVGNSRSATYLDFDADGDLDIAVNNFHAPATLLRNELNERDANWLKLRLIGDPGQRSNRDAIGAQILLTADGGLRVRREIHGGSGYLSMNPRELHFGLGSAEFAHLQITWPNGAIQRLGPLAANRVHRVRQSEPSASLGGCAGSQQPGRE